MDWPQWATWALLAVVVTSIVTIAVAKKRNIRRGRQRCRTVR
jgi:hypothetical protein